MPGQARGLRHVRVGAVGGAEGRGVAVVGVAHGVVEPVGTEQGGAAVVAAIVDGGRIQETPIVFQGHDGAVEGIVAASSFVRSRVVWAGTVSEDRMRVVQEETAALRDE